MKSISSIIDVISQANAAMDDPSRYKGVFVAPVKDGPLFVITPNLQLKSPFSHARSDIVSSYYLSEKRNMQSMGDTDIRFR